MALDNESWIISAGDAVIAKRATAGIAALEPLERLIYCLWVADYGMRNAGDLETAGDLCETFQADALSLATQLGLPSAQSMFGLERARLELRYFELFDDVCDEIRKAHKS